MKELCTLFLVAVPFLMAVVAGAEDVPKAEPDPRVLLKTTKGEILIELYPGKAPVTVENFLAYVQEGLYNGTVFHRVIPGFMIQGGGLTPDLRQKPTKPPIRNEANNGLKNERGAIAMARTGDPHSATAQFFINVVDNAFLNHTAPTPQGWGYAVFGRVVKGMEVADAIAAVPTKVGLYQNVPKEPVIIESAEVVKN